MKLKGRIGEWSRQTHPQTEGELREKPHLAQQQGSSL